MSALPKLKAKQDYFSGERLRMAREAYGWTQDVFAEAVGVSRTQITNLERGNSEPSVRMIVACALALKVSADWLLLLTDEPPSWMTVVEETVTIKRYVVKAEARS